MFADVLLENALLVSTFVFRLSAFDFRFNGIALQF
jgi:hypothetical protein